MRHVAHTCCSIRETYVTISGGFHPSSNSCTTRLSSVAILIMANIQFWIALRLRDKVCVHLHQRIPLFSSQISAPAFWRECHVECLLTWPRIRYRQPNIVIGLGVFLGISISSSWILYYSTKNLNVHYADEFLFQGNLGSNAVVSRPQISTCFTLSLLTRSTRRMGPILFAFMLFSCPSGNGSLLEGK